MSWPFDVDIGGDPYLGSSPVLAADYAAIEVQMMAAFGAAMAVCPVCGAKSWGMGDYLGRGKPTEESLILSHAREKKDAEHAVLYVMSA